MNIEIPESGPVMSTRLFVRQELRSIPCSLHDRARYPKLADCVAKLRRGNIVARPFLRVSIPECNCKNYQSGRESSVLKSSSRSLLGGKTRSACRRCNRKPALRQWSAREYGAWEAVQAPGNHHRHHGIVASIGLFRGIVIARDSFPDFRRSTRPPK